ncbi:pseudouridine synthase [Planctomicrobium sp. SH661]|uniref:pseudouridine synthase n=1 Tax=Planctomicrobium sp. SH661 TaxID=3448124 RepID=UPI003F5BDF26
MSSPQDSVPPSFKPIRLQRFLAQCGLGSRRDCEELITAGRVEVDGRTANELGTTVDPSTQTVSLDGERLKVERKKYFMLNKPSGFLCTSEDPQGRRVVLDLFPEEGPRLFTVGRLDENTTGLLLVTNDGDLAQKLAHPRYRIFRLYRAQVAGQPKAEVFEQLRQGLFFTEGKFRVHGVKPIKKQKDSTWVEITMTEGQNREIRRLFARVGHKVMKLERIGYGPLRLGRLAMGEYRDLSREELGELHAVLDRNQKGDALLTPEERRQARTRSEKPVGTSERRPAGRTSAGPGASAAPAGKWPRKAVGRTPTGKPREERGERPSRTGGPAARSQDRKSPRPGGPGRGSGPSRGPKGKGRRPK